MERVAAHMFIEGRVQGVFYRGFTAEVARTLGLSGWVRNLGDGRVEAVLGGDKKVIQKAIEECYIGPPGSHVRHIEVKWEPYDTDLKGFSVKY
jgi:acylphosphatase